LTSSERELRQCGGARDRRPCGVAQPGLIVIFGPFSDLPAQPGAVDAEHAAVLLPE
jgi:hypothetical protein